jgi:hypothetical protein
MWPDNRIQISLGLNCLSFKRQWPGCHSPPAQKIEQLLRDGLMQGSSPCAAAYSDARGKYMLRKAVAKATLIRLLQAERPGLSG